MIATVLATAVLFGFGLFCGLVAKILKENWLKYEVNGSVPNAAVAATSPEN
jgi:hypothetical protein